MTVSYLQEVFHRNWLTGNQHNCGFDLFLVKAGSYICVKYRRPRIYKNKIQSAIVTVDEYAGYDQIVGAINKNRVKEVSSDVAIAAVMNIKEVRRKHKLEFLSKIFSSSDINYAKIRHCLFDDLIEYAKGIEYDE